MKFELVLDRKIADESYRKIFESDRMVIDLGAKKRSNKSLDRYRGPRVARYFCTDIFPGDLDFVSDIHAIPIASESLDAAICHSVIEHVEEPWTVMKEIHRILRPGGVAFIYAPFLYPYHAENTVDTTKQGGQDCYRFTLDGLRYLCRDFSVMKASPVDYGLATWWRFAVFFNLSWAQPTVERFQRLAHRLLGHPVGVNQASGFEVWLEK